MGNTEGAETNQQAPSSSREFACNSCGATLVYNAGVKQLKCDYCGSEQVVPSETVVAEEHDITELEGKTGTTGFGIESKSFKCENCGAATSCAPNITAAKCAFCGSPRVIDTPANPDLIRPETMIPFQVDRKTAMDKFREWIRKLWFRPNDLKKIARLSDISGVYTPFWTFDCNTHSDWAADAGYYYYETEHYTDHENGKQVRKTRQVRKVRWEPASGSHSAFYNDELVCASKGLYFDLMKQIYPFDLTRLTPYKPEFLSGWLAEEYDLGPEAGWDLARDSINNKERSACSDLVPGDTQRNLQVSTDHSDIRWKHVLLPVWLAAYQYHGKAFRFLVNGQTGEVRGEAPISWWKVGLAIVVGAAILAAVYYFTQGK